MRHRDISVVEAVPSISNFPGVDLADGGLRSGGALEQRRLVIESRLAIEISVTLRGARVRLCLCEAGALVGHVDVTLS